MSDSLPSDYLELRSTVSDDSSVTVGIHRAELHQPGDEHVVVRVDAAPINPSDLGMLLAGADLASAAVVDGDLPAVRLDLGAGAFAGQAGRLGKPMPVGNEGGGEVVAAGSSEAAQAMLGKTVGFVSGNSYSQYQTLHISQCLPMPDGTTSEQAAAPFVNPLTALGMVETMRSEGHTALIHTVGASNLGLMLNRICQADGVGLVNIVRKQEHVDQLTALGAVHVCNSSADSFEDDLADAIRTTGATIAFDAIGGGEMANTLLAVMENVLSADSEFSRYGSDTHKQVYIYGGLDRGPTTLRRTFGMSWSIGGWLLTPFLGKIGTEAAGRLRQRVADEIATTFASDYGMRISLSDAVDPATVQRYGLMATGDKALIVPHA
ncbi:MAG: zinc-binding dehydrogenase [Actinomycetota bacterium]